MREWTAAKARTHLSAVLREARTDGPQLVTLRGEPTAVVVSLEEWNEVCKRVRERDAERGGGAE